MQVGCGQNPRTASTGDPATPPLSCPHLPSVSSATHTGGTLSHLLTHRLQPLFLVDPETCTKSSKCHRSSYHGDHQALLFPLFRSRPEHGTHWWPPLLPRPAPCLPAASSSDPRASVASVLGGTPESCFLFGPQPFPSRVQGQVHAARRKTALPSPIYLISRNVTGKTPSSLLLNPQALQQTTLWGLCQPVQPTLPPGSDFSLGSGCGFCHRGPWWVVTMSEMPRR